MKIEKAPYYAAIYIAEKYVCIGVLVSLTHVVTAAHCLILKIRIKN